MKQHAHRIDHHAIADWDGTIDEAQVAKPGVGPDTSPRQDRTVVSWAMMYAVKAIQTSLATPV